MQEKYSPLDTPDVLDTTFFWENNEVCVQEGLDVFVSVSILNRNKKT